MGKLSMIKGKVVLVPFPFDDLSAMKVRPAVCLTNPIGPHRHVVLAFISSQIPRYVLPTDVVLDSGRSDFSATGLRVSSTLRLHRLMTATTSLICVNWEYCPLRYTLKWIANSTNCSCYVFFFFSARTTHQIYPLPRHDALPI